MTLSNIKHELKSLLQLMTSEFKSAPKPQAFDFTLKSHVGKSLEQLKSEMQEAGKETLVIEDVMVEAVSKNRANLTELAYPTTPGAFATVSQALKTVTRQGYANGISHDLYDQMFTDRIVSLDKVDAAYQKVVFDKYIEDTRPIVEAFVKQMASYAQQQFQDSLKYAGDFRDILAEVLHFTVNYTPGNDTTP